MEHGAELLIDAPMAQRGKRMMAALAEAAPAGSQVTRAYTGSHRLLVMYGVGLEQRMQAREQHLAKGGHVVMWDLGYWDREEAMRLTVNSTHPTLQQMACAPATGTRRPVRLREDASADGPVLLVGLGHKSAAMLGYRTRQWEKNALRWIAQKHPGKRVLWRPKGRYAEPLAGTTLSHGTPIEQALQGCSLVVCRHSNVAIDACIAGVPVQCWDGAALALYENNPAPSREDRSEFLRRLGWFNWFPREAADAWHFVQRLSA